MRCVSSARYTYKQGLNASDDDIIQLNVGGQKFTTKRSTSCQINGLMISTFHWKAYFIRITIVLDSLRGGGGRGGGDNTG